MRIHAFIQSCILNIYGSSRSVWPCYGPVGGVGGRVMVNKTGQSLSLPRAPLRRQIKKRISQVYKISNSGKCFGENKAGRRLGLLESGQGGHQRGCYWALDSKEARKQAQRTAEGRALQAAGTAQAEALKQG